ncbi:alpha/beta hydrolase fold domain-containing protein [Herbiconiux solani]|uniref:alpha/beta hydrolase fold domain-containing protein n=1 Tax=Herbiconiux solani TaxID=661329 RepID=UPI0008243754|nr:alpha/beta hydrolase fold domain-containing protein [Herbiconiux solani]
MTIAMRLTRFAAGVVFSARRGQAEPAERRAAWLDRPYPEPARIPKRLERLCHIETTTRHGRPVITLTPRGGGGAAVGARADTGGAGAGGGAARAGAGAGPVDPAGAASPAAEIVYLHGGAYVNPLLGAHWAIIEQLVRRMDARVTVPLYGLAPWHTVDDALPLLREVYDEVRARTDGPVLIAGDSAGGGLALALAMELRDEGAPPPDALLLISPWVDVRLENPGIPPLEPGDRMLGAGTLRLAGDLWRGSRSADDPVVSPIADALAGLPPIRAVVGGKEIFVPDVRAFARKARAAGTDAELRIYPDGFHDFVGATFTLEARDALAWFAAAVPTTPAATRD